MHCPWHSRDSLVYTRKHCAAPFLLRDPFTALASVFSPGVWAGTVLAVLAAAAIISLNHKVSFYCRERYSLAQPSRRTREGFQGVRVHTYVYITCVERFARSVTSRERSTWSAPSEHCLLHQTVLRLCCTVRRITLYIEPMYKHKLVDEIILLELHLSLLLSLCPARGALGIWDRKHDRRRSSHNAFLTALGVLAGQQGRLQLPDDTSKRFLLGNFDS